MATASKSSSTHRGQAIYGRTFLSAYDTIVYRFNSPLLWRCPLERLVDHYGANLSSRHLDSALASGAGARRHRRAGAAPAVPV